MISVSPWETKNQNIHNGIVDEVNKLIGHDFMVRTDISENEGFGVLTADVIINQGPELLLKTRYSVNTILVLFLNKDHVFNEMTKMEKELFILNQLRSQIRHDPNIECLKVMHS